MNASKTISQEIPQTFPMNAWYAAAWDAEVKRELLSRRICGFRMVFYRTENGDPVALHDACWHRLVPLSMGRLKGDEVQCPYHGLVFNAQGRCTHMPAQETINPSARVKSFPVVERHRFLWVWPGDPTLADPDLIPDLHWNHDPAWAGDGSTIHAACDYRLIIDNLMDLTHETYIHGSSIGQDEILEAPFEVEHGERTATLSRWMIGIDPPPFLRAQLKNVRKDFGLVDRWQIIRFEAPSTVAIDVGVCPTGTGAPQGNREQGVSMVVINTITPATDTTCHYFWANARDYCLTEQRVTTQVRQAITKVFAEDEVIVEAQQKAIDENPGYDFYDISPDAGAMWARRLINKMIESEHPSSARMAAE